MSYRLKRILGAGGVGAGSAPPASPFTIEAYANGTGLAMMGMAFAADGTIYVALSMRHVVLKVDPRTQQATLFAGTWDTAGSTGDGGAATSAQLQEPSGLAVASNGDVYIADRTGHKVRKVAFSTGHISTYMGTGTSGSSGDGGLPGSALVSFPSAVAIAADGTIFVACDDRIRRIDFGTGFVSTPFAGSSGSVTSQNIVCDSNSNAYFVQGSGVNTKISKIDTSGTLTAAFFTRSTSYGGMGIGKDDNLYLINTQGASDIVKVNTGGSPSETSVTGVNTADSAHQVFSGEGIASATYFMAQSLGQQKLYVDETGTIYVASTDYLYAHVLPVTALETYTNPVFVGTTTVGFSDEDTRTMLLGLLSGSTDADNTGTRPSTSLSAYHGGADNIWIIGASYSNLDANQIESSPGVIRQLFLRSLAGVQDVNFQNRGGGEGTGFGADAMRIQVRNGNGNFLVERWLNGSEVNDYAIILSTVLSGKLLTFVAGIRDISTKAAAFVAANSQNAAYTSFFSASNAILVHTKYPTSVTTPSAFTPTTTNTKVIRMDSVAGVRPNAF